MSQKKPIQKSLFETVEDKIKYSTSSVEELRVPIYAPVKQLPPQSVAAKDFKKNNNVRIIETKWGHVEIRNRLLTQTHKDIMDLIFTYNKKIRRLEDGTIAVYFSQSEIAKFYSDDIENKSKNLRWFRQKLDEISDCRIQYKDKNGNEIDFRIILKKAFSSKENLYGIVLDPNYVEFYERGLSINYSSKIPDLLSVDSPLVKSIIRFFFTHKAINLSLENILTTVGFPLPASTRTLQTAKKTLREHIDVFKSFDIIYDSKKEIFYYKGTDDVFINMPIDMKTKVLPEFED
ncbi:hypothetical protein [Sulfurimonas paralvinellae]|uniref:Replication initiation protein n=1 Tax=Sulfurimonas paralvinellae TaxID=317658 RepID=A0A7M1BBK2_9BACT|nr:hypothetical protein [Sulfurimonas paralvinellae]QOP46816.1 hypothetical protein FM071_10595 [Sulfurimonas paralvinellae]